MSFFLRLELGSVYLQLGRIEEPEEDAEAIGLFVDSGTPTIVDAPRPGFRVTSDVGEISTDV